MQQEQEEWAGPQFPARDAVLAGFPGLIAVAAPMVGVAASVAVDSNDEDAWAVEIGYFTPDRYLLTVRTIRSAQGLSSYGLPVEDLLSAVVNFQLAAAARADSSHSGLAPDAAQEWIDEQRQAIQFTRAQVAAIPPSPTALTVNHSTVSGIGVVLDGCVAVQLRWQRQTIFCAGRSDLLADLKLAMVDSEHLAVHTDVTRSSEAPVAERVDRFLEQTRALDRRHGRLTCPNSGQRNGRGKPGDLWGFIIWTIASCSGYEWRGIDGL